MKYVVVLYDGMADYPVDALNGKTPMEVASTPAMDELAKSGQVDVVPVATSALNQSVDGYKFSSYNEYINKAKLVDTDFCFEIIDREQFIEFNNQFNDDVCLDIADLDYRLTDDDAMKIIWKVCGCKSVSEFQKFDKVKRNSYIAKLYHQGLSIRQISRLTGCSRKIVENNIQ